MSSQEAADNGSGHGTVMRRAVVYVLRALGIMMALVLLWWMMSRTGADPLAVLRRSRGWLLAVSVVCVGLTHLLGGWRWGIELEVQGVHCSLWLLYRLTLVGNFFSQIIPGAVSGDVLKLAYVVRQNPGKGAAAVMSGLVDRIVGVSGLFLVASLGGGLYGVLHPEVMKLDSLAGLALLLVFCGGAGSLLALVVLVYHGMLLRVGLIRRLVAWVAGMAASAKQGQAGPRGKVCRVLAAGVGVFSRLCQAAGVYRNHRWVLVQALLISMVIHFLLGCALFCIGRAAGETVYSFGAYFLSIQVGNAMTLIPAAPGGLGVRDGVTFALFRSLGDGDMALMGSIPLVYSLAVLFWAVWGAVALFFLPRRPSDVEGESGGRHGGSVSQRNSESFRGEA